VTMSNISGVFTNWGEAYGRFVEVFTDGHWWVVGDSLENIGKTTKRLLVNAYPFLYGGSSSFSGLKGSSPKKAGYAKPTKAIEQRFKD
jgi:chlorosome envelope protein E